MLDFVQFMGVNVLVLANNHLAEPFILNTIEEVRSRRFSYAGIGQSISHCAFFTSVAFLFEIHYLAPVAELDV